MKHRKRKSLLSTSLAVYLSLNIQIQQDDGEKRLLTFPLLQLTTWLMMAWQLRAGLHRVVGFVETVSNGLANWIKTQQIELQTAAILFGIGIRSLLYGFGVIG